ncbi:MAG TPA: hypothetical protein VNH11_32925 [Pirellulales bacterium]|nr:hypothetical protein [Pirellulales bacterium]
MEQRAGLYRTQVAHDAVLGPNDVAVLCFDFADVAAQGCNLFQSIKELNDDYRTLVAKEDLEYDETLERRIIELYEEWLQTSVRALEGFGRIAREYNAHGFDTARIERLRACCDEAGEILKEDAEWDELERTALSSQRIDAIAAHLLSTGEAST